MFIRQNITNNLIENLPQYEPRGGGDGQRKMKKKSDEEQADLPRYEPKRKKKIGQRKRKSAREKGKKNGQTKKNRLQEQTT
jgi:hypothetical protein